MNTDSNDPTNKHLSAIRLGISMLITVELLEKTSLELGEYPIPGLLLATGIYFFLGMEMRFTRKKK